MRRALRRFLTRLTREHDPIDDQLRELERQGTGQARVAHFFGILLIVLFSLASVITLGGDTLNAIVDGLQHGTLPIPSAITLAVTFLLVPSMDSAMIYAGSMLRLQSMRGAAKREMRLHKGVLIGISFIEASTSIAMSYLYEHPTTLWQWGLIGIRNLPAPLIANYLTLARPLPVTHRDIMSMVEHAAALGLLRDATRLANDPTRPLTEKVRLYLSAARASVEERHQLEQMILLLADQEAQRALPAPATNDVQRPNAPDDQEGQRGANPDFTSTRVTRSNTGRTDDRRRTTARERLPRADAGMTAKDREQLEAKRREATDRAIYNAFIKNRPISVASLQQQIAIRTQHPISKSKVAELMREYVPIVRARIEQEKSLIATDEPGTDANSTNGEAATA